MKAFFIVFDILLVIIDLFVFIRLWRIFKTHSQGDELVVPTKKVLPYGIAMAVISILVPVIGICLRFV